MKYKQLKKKPVLKFEQFSINFHYSINFFKLK